jgi:NDP-sugar pyrophosphorylase family protein
MFTGVQVLEPRIFDHMRSDVIAPKFSTTKDTYPELLLKNEALYGFRFDGYWQDLGTQERIREAETSLLQGTTRLHYL